MLFSSEKLRALLRARAPACLHTSYPSKKGAERYVCDWLHNELV